MDEADEFCVGKGYDGAADKLTRQELDDLHAEWKDMPTVDKTGHVYALKLAYTNVGGGHCTDDCVFRWCDGPCSKLPVPGDRGPIQQKKFGLSFGLKNHSRFGLRFPTLRKCSKTG